MSEKIKHDCSRSKCPITNALDIVGDKWTLLIIRDMMFLGKTQFNAFLESNEGISTNILTARLKKLEQLNLVKKEAYQTAPRRYAYSLTKPGESLRPILIEMVKWGADNIDGAYTPTREQMERLKKGQL